MWAFNQGLMTGVIKPTSRVYRFVVVKPVRTGIGNFGKNLTYPGRLINNPLQEKWGGARDESYRFVCNTTVGVAGFFDVASKWKIPKGSTAPIVGFIKESACFPPSRGQPCASRCRGVSSNQNERLLGVF